MQCLAGCLSIPEPACQRLRRAQSGSMLLARIRRSGLDRVEGESYVRSGLRSRHACWSSARPFQGH